MLYAIAVTFIDAAEVSKCYSVNNETSCFYTNDTTGSVLKWDDAIQFCATKNSTLPIITDANLDHVFQQFIVNYSYVTQGRSVWLDAHARHVDSSSRWHWIDGQSSGMAHWSV